MAAADSTQGRAVLSEPISRPGLGYPCLALDGPGQRMTLRKQGLTPRPNWGYVTRHILDYLITYSVEHPEFELDLDRIAVSGSTLEGYFAFQVAADLLIKACVAIDPLYDTWDFGTRHMWPPFINAWMGRWLSQSTVDSMISLRARLNFQLNWEISVKGAFWKLERPTDILLEMKKHTVRRPNSKNCLDRVSCPILISGAANSWYLNMDSHAMMVWRHLNSEADPERELWIAHKPANGALQAKIGAFELSNEYTFRFLDQKLSVERTGLMG